MGLGWGSGSDIGGQGQGLGALYNEVQYIMGNGHMGTPSRGQNDSLMDRHDCKHYLHYLPATSLAGGKNNKAVEFFTNSLQYKNTNIANPI